MEAVKTIVGKEGYLKDLVRISGHQLSHHWPGGEVPGKKMIDG